METAGYIFATAIGAGFLYGFARGFMRQRDAQGWARRQLAHHERKLAEQNEKLDSAARQAVDRFFPFVRDQFKTNRRANESSAELSPNTEKRPPRNT